jgi:hypothetical protein
MRDRLLRLALALVVVLRPVHAQDVVGLQVMPATIRCNPGETTRLQVFSVRSDGSRAKLADGKAKFSSSDSSVATVDTIGHVLARSAGGASIYVSFETVQRQVTVTVLRVAGSAPTATAPPAVPPPAARVVKSLRIVPDHMQLLPTERARYTITAEFDDGTSGIPPVFSVAVFGAAARLDSASSEVVGALPGESQLGVRVQNGPAVSIPIRVVEASLHLDRDTLALAEGSADSVTVTTNESPPRRLTTGLVWKSTNRGVIVPVDSFSGAVRAGAAGTGDIIVDGYGETLRLPVVTYTPVASLRRTGELREQITIPIGLQASVGATAIAANGSEVKGVPLRWSIADSTVVSLDRAKGVLVARRDGSTDVSVRVAGVPTLTWHVRAVAARLAIASAPKYLVIGEAQQLRAVWIGPEGDTLKASSLVSWRSSNSRSLAIDDSGRVAALESGSASIRATFGERYLAETPVRVTGDFLATLQFPNDSTAIAELSVRRRTLEQLPGFSNAKFASWTGTRDRIVASRRTMPSKAFALFISSADGSGSSQFSRPRDADDVQACWFVQSDRIAFLNGRGSDYRVAAQQVDDTLAATLLVRGKVRGLSRRRRADDFLVIREIDGRSSVWIATATAPEKPVVEGRRGAIDSAEELPDGSLLMVADTSSGRDRFALVRWSNGIESALDVTFPNAGRLRSATPAADGVHAVVVADHPTAKQGSVVFWVDLATKAVVELLRTEQYKVVAPRA